MPACSSASKSLFTGASLSSARSMNPSRPSLLPIEKLGMTKQHRLGDTGSARAMADHHDIRVTDGAQPVLDHCFCRAVEARCGQAQCLLTHANGKAGHSL